MGGIKSKATISHVKRMMGDRGHQKQAIEVASSVKS